MGDNEEEFLDFADEFPSPEEDANERQFWEDYYGDVVGVASLGITHRLHGARLAAGIVYSSEAARLLDMHEATYRHSEDGLRPVNEELVEKASELYGVTRSYLMDGVASTETEILAERLATILQTVDVDDLETDETYFDVLKRLREMRMAAGYKSPGAAAAAHGWNRSTYWQHETGMRGITIDRLIAYSLTMGARPEWSVTGVGDREEMAAIGWVEKEKATTAPPSPLNMGR